MRLAARARSCRGPGGLDRLRLRSLSPPQRGRPRRVELRLLGLALPRPCRIGRHMRVGAAVLFRRATPDNTGLLRRRRCRLARRGAR